MKTRRSFLSLIGLTTVVSVAAAFAAPGPGHDHAKAKVGEPAPNFTLKDVTGKEYTLADYKGKIVVLQWINPKCPVCYRVMSGDVAKKMVKQIKALDKDIVHLAIDSSHFATPEGSAKYLKEFKIEAPALSDLDGTVGRLYGARTTPHMYVIDKEGILRYSGAIDDDRPGANGSSATNYVVNAVSQIVASETVAPDTTKPYGCNVKYQRKSKGKSKSGYDKS